MRRWPLVLSGTVAGLVGVLTFHTTQAKSGLPTLSGVSSPQTSAAGAGGSGGSAAGAGTAKGKAPGKPTSAGQRATATRTVVGSAVDYNFGILSVRVTVSGKKIVNVGIASLDDGSNPRSQMIDQESIPLLEQEVMQAQSANIQGISGASFTSEGFVQSLQSALQSLGVQ